MHAATASDRMNSRALRLLTGLACLGCSVLALAQNPSPPWQPPEPQPITKDSPPTFAGRVRIAGRIADPGVLVQVVLFSGQQFTVCADGGVTDVVHDGQYDGFWYNAVLSKSEECNRPSNLFQFYVNGVWGGEARYEFSPQKRLKIAHLATPEVALDTKKENVGMKSFWVYGTVKMRRGGPAPDGTQVRVTAKGQEQCSGTARTHHLGWQPKGGGRPPIDFPGFYSIGLPMQGCANKDLLLQVFAGQSDKVQSSVQVHSPVYGTAHSGNAIIDE